MAATPPPQSTAPTFPLALPSTSKTATSEPPTPFSHGAEAHLYLTHHLLADPTRLCVLKHRPRKPYRHPTLDARLTRHRILSEARVLAKLRRDQALASSSSSVQVDDVADAPVDVPALWAADWEAGWLMMEYVRGGTVRERLGAWKGAQRGSLHPRPRQPARQIIPEDEQSRQGETEGVSQEHKADSTMNGWAPNPDAESEIRDLLWRVGRAVGRLHRAGVVHGDLTTGNMLIRNDEDDRNGVTGSTAPISTPGPPGIGAADGGPAEQPARIVSLAGPITLIDFGLAAQTISEEDRAVDLYVLERALGSSHPGLEAWFDDVLMVGYTVGLGGGGSNKAEKGGRAVDGAAASSSPQVKAVRRKLEEVRGRGRKRSMIG